MARLLVSTTIGGLVVAGGASVDIASSSALTISGGGTNNGAINVSDWGSLNVSGLLTNNGPINLTGYGLLRVSSPGAVLTNNATISVESNVESSNGIVGICGRLVNNSLIRINPPQSHTLFGYLGCGGTATLYNAPSGTIESLSGASLRLPGAGMAWENHGSIVSRAGVLRLDGGGSDAIHTGQFSSADDGHLVLCGLFLLADPAVVAENVGLGDRCGTLVADVTDFTAQQIQDVRNARTAAMGLVNPGVSDIWPECYFRGVNLVELYGYYPDICVYTPQQFGADAFEFYIEWMPGLGAALDIGHAIFGMDLAGRELSPSERILDGLFAVVPGAVDVSLLKGTERLRYRAFIEGFDDACNSFDGPTLVRLADGSAKPISQVRPADIVLAADPKTGVVGPRPVTNVITGTGEKHLVDIDLSSGERITATSNHPFWVEDLDDYVEAGSLFAGSMLRTGQGTYVQVTAVGARTEWTRVYNLTVANLHTFFVGDAEVLVHNTNPVCGNAARTALRASLGASPYTNGQAHHIYGVSQYTNNPALTNRLANQFQIDLNSAVNGLYLPSGEYAGLPSSFGGAWHTGRSADYYTLC